MVIKIKEIELVLIAAFNLGVILRLTADLLNAQNDETKSLKDILKQNLKALIVGNSISGLVIVIESYFGR